MNLKINQMISAYFKHMTLVREDIRDIINQYGLIFNNVKICDFGCGSGITTFALALEFDESICIGLDKFPEKSKYSFDDIQKIKNALRNLCLKNKPVAPIRLKKPIKNDLCKLVYNNRIPNFMKGDIIIGNRLPKGIDFAFCQKILVNIKKGTSGEQKLEQDTLVQSIKNIVNSLKPKGYLLSIEYKNFDFYPYIKECCLEKIRSFEFTRNEIRSRGRTTVLSHFTAFLCQKLNENQI